MPHVLYDPKYPEEQFFNHSTGAISIHDEDSERLNKESVERFKARMAQRQQQESIADPRGEEISLTSILNG